MVGNGASLQWWMQDRDDFSQTILSSYGGSAGGDHEKTFPKPPLHYLHSPFSQMITIRDISLPVTLWS